MKSYKETKADILWAKMNNRQKLVNHCEVIKKEIEDIQSQIKELGSPKSPSFDKVAQITVETDRTESKLLSLITKEKQYENEYYLTKAQIAEVDTILNLLKEYPDAYKICIFKFVKCETWRSAEEEFFYTQRALEKKIRKALQSLITELKENEDDSKTVG